MHPRHAMLDRQDRIAAAALFAITLATYFATSSAHLTGADNAEFVTIFADGGVPHPPGYPLYCILLRRCAWMPGGAVLASSRVSAILGALSVTMLYRACRSWEASSAASLVATAFYALSPLAWRLATEAEVFALNALFASVLLYAASPALAIAPERRVIFLAGLAGLALSNHHTIVLLAPVGLLAMTRALRESQRWLRAGSLGVAAFGAGLLPYLYCYAVGRAPDGRYVWGEPGTLGGLLRHVLRTDYGTLRLTASERATDPLANLALYVRQTASHTLVVPLAIGLFGFWRAYAGTSAPVAPRRGAAPLPASPSPLRPRSRDALALFFAWTLAGPVFALFLGVSPGGLGASLVERFRLLPEVVFTIGIAWGLDAWPGLRERRVRPLALVALAIVAVAGLHSWPQVRSEHTNALELYTENTKRAAPARAVILGTGDYRLFSFLYEDARKLRPDVTYIDPHLVGYDWYRARASRELGAPLPAQADPSAEAIALADRAFALGRPVFVTDVFDPRVVKVFPSYPLGTLIRLLPRGAALPPVETVESENLGVFAGFQRCETARPSDEWASAVLPAYQRPWIALARMFERKGDPARARTNAERGEAWNFLRDEAPVP